MMNGMNQEELMRLLSTSGGNRNQLQQIQSILQSQLRQGESPGAGFRPGQRAPSSSTKKEEPKEESSKSSTPAPAPSTSPTPATTDTDGAAATAASGVQLQDLQSILRNMSVPSSSAAASVTPCDISEAMKPDDIIPMLANEQIRESLLKHLPESTQIPKTEAELKETIHAPQFQQACNAFSSALSTGQLGPVLQQFGVPPAAVEAANKGDVAGFAKAMEEGSKTEAAKEEDKMETD
jgi:26S proteasome regulatory subunit N13